MNEIKSVRIRKKSLNYGSLDIKVTLYEDVDNIIVNGTNNGNIVWKNLIYKRNGIYSNYMNNDFINDFINLNSKLENSTYNIIQDPWLEKTPIWRSYGFDPYYLNNGSVILISWKDINGNDVGGHQFSNDDGTEINSISTNTKSLVISFNGQLIYFTKNNIFSSVNIENKKWGGLVKDIDIIKEIIDNWNSKIPGYGLDICSPNNQSCHIIEYASPLLPPTDIVSYPNNSDINKLPKIKMNVVMPNGLLKVKNDILLKVFIGNNSQNVDDFIYNPEDEDISQYLESTFEGLSEEEFNIQDEISNGQIDSDSNLGVPGEPADIKPVGSFDALLRLAGQCARELGKNPRVNYQNLRIGYVKGIHGLCPQGTFAVLYALTGIKSLGQLRGNANAFSMNGSKGLPSSYFNSKIRVGKEYFDNPSSWQIGDIIAVDYNGRPYGHIQVWTGVKWVSDFTQNTLQRNHVDWASVALHRMNTSGIMATKNQSGTIA